MSICQLDVEVSSLCDRTVVDKGGNKRYVLSGYTGQIAGWGRGTIDIMWKIPKAFGGFYEVLEIQVKEKDIKISKQRRPVRTSLRARS